MAQTQIQFYPYSKLTHKVAIRFKVIRWQGTSQYPYVIVKQELDKDGFVKSESLIGAYSSFAYAENSIIPMKRIYAAGVVVD